MITASLASQHKQPYSWRGSCESRHRKEDTDAEMAKQLYAMQMQAMYSAQPSAFPGMVPTYAPGTLQGGYSCCVC